MFLICLKLGYCNGPTEDEVELPSVLVKVFYSGTMAFTNTMSSMYLLPAARVGGQCGMHTGKSC